MQFLKCESCGKIVAELVPGNPQTICCDQPMTELIPNSVDAAQEKHVPVVTADGSAVTVTVGSVEHPMLEEHHIAWIILETNQGYTKKDLNPGDKPCAVFALAEGEVPVAAYEYCNLHGLWKAEIAEEEEGDQGPRMLISYFSPGGVTKTAAELIAEVTGGSLYEIKPEQPYTDAGLDWTDSAARSNIEMSDKNSRPNLAEALPAADSFDILFVGYPLWWGTAPRTVDTFIEGLHLDGKLVVPFCTSGGTGVEKSETELKELVRDQVVWHKALRLTKDSTAEEVTSWLSDLLK